MESLTKVLTSGPARGWWRWGKDMSITQWRMGDDDAHNDLRPVDLVDGLCYKDGASCEENTHGDPQDA